MPTTPAVAAHINCVADIKFQFKETGRLTPARGLLYEDVARDMCAVSYDNGRKAKVFSHRREGFEARECTPCFFVKCKYLTN